MGDSLISLGLIMMVVGPAVSLALGHWAKRVRCVSLCLGAVVVMCGLANNAGAAEAGHRSGSGQVIPFVVFALIAAAAGMRARHHYKYPNGKVKVAEQKRPSTTIPRTIPSTQPRGRVLDDVDCVGLSDHERDVIAVLERQLAENSR